MNRSVTRSALVAFAAVSLLFTALAAAVTFGGPAPIAPLAGIKAPLSKAAFSAVPQAGPGTRPGVFSGPESIALL
ncbi:MAG: hypothetical protein PSV26_15310 [Polaromonas sp.]|uniref:hypothetical protein n=1 Tax=Polaromonas sp. TaxID=1869339 RepID=UPI002487BF51|nr:hypothetical protein [Polaromonas sp.]MDI1238849.1 hypothetical protein [Polaromonas sp.]MDI1340555.1 hypothetical protein [Polaromonas sp.]